MDKNQFHRKYKKELRSLALRLQLTPDSYDVRSNKGGPAVLGEVILHSERLYLQIGGSLADPNDATQLFLYRTCKGQKDYTGGRNRFAPLSQLNDWRVFQALHAIATGKITE